MLAFEEIEAFCAGHCYDLRISGNGRWIDQKCTPDVLWSVADYVLEYVDNTCRVFSVKDIWRSEYAGQTIAETYSKPGTDVKSAENEYDKVFSQPLCMLCYAGVLRDVSPNRLHRYMVENRAVLEYIAKNDQNALRFLCCYIKAVLTQSGLYPVFQAFFDKQDKARFETMKQAFIDFTHQYTAIKKDYEPKRIFSKVLNPLAYKNGRKGTERGHMSPHVIKKADMMYNRDNFRDIYQDKPKGVSRRQWLAQHPDIDQRSGYFQQMMSHTKKALRENIASCRSGLSEFTQFAAGHTDTAPATQLHHIFPKNEFPEIMHYAENMIALTPNQHFGFAHPYNNTQLADPAAQEALLAAKVCSIQKNLEDPSEESIYDFSRLLIALSVGWEDLSILEVAPGDYAAVLRAIRCHYSHHT